MALDHSRLGLENKQGQIEFFAFDKFTLQNLANKSRGGGGGGKQYYNCFYHTDLGQNLVIYNLAIQIALIKQGEKPKLCHLKLDFRLSQAKDFSTKNPSE